MDPDEDVRLQLRKTAIGNSVVRRSAASAIGESDYGHAGVRRPGKPLMEELKSKAGTGGSVEVTANNLENVVDEQTKRASSVPLRIDSEGEFGEEARSPNDSPEALAEQRQG